MVEEQARWQQMPLCVDARLSRTDGTGVASYAKAVIEALTADGLPPLLLEDAARGRFGERASLLDKARRRFRSGMSRSVALSRTDHGLFGHDVYRLAQVRFDVSGETLPLVVPGPPGIMHWTYPIPARIVGWRNIYTVHDVIPLTDPSLSPVDTASLRHRIEAIASIADRIVTVSEASRAAILDTIAIPADHVVDCGGAVVDLARDRTELPAELQIGGYHLYCGLIEPRKNIARIVAGWRASGITRPLVLAGPDAAGGNELRRELGDIDGVRWLGWQPRDQLVTLIAQARSLIFPTLAEGFGLPVAEAMALGTPVLTSDRGALAETAGGAALLVDPYDISAIGTGIARLDADAGLRAALIAKGSRRCVAFTPTAFGDRLRALHAELIGDHATLA